MHPATPTLDDAVIPGIRRIWEHQTTLASTVDNFSSTPVLPARSVLRLLYFMANLDLSASGAVTLELAYGGAATPVAADFTGTGRILPDIGPVGFAPAFSPDNELAATYIPVNYQLPPVAGRLMIRINNQSTVTITARIRLLIDGIARLGDPNGSR